MTLVLKNLLASFFGGLFAVGLIVSGMANPKKVLDFLDLFGTWDASLAFVMAGAILVALFPFQKAVRQAEPKTVFQEPINLPKHKKIDAKLIIGSMLFGIGWGIAGICPAPSFTLIGLGYLQVLYFIVAMLAGIYLFNQVMGEK